MLPEGFIVLGDQSKSRTIQQTRRFFQFSFFFLVFVIEIKREVSIFLRKHRHFNRPYGCIEGADNGVLWSSVGEETGVKPFPSERVPLLCHVMMPGVEPGPHP